MLFQWWRNSEWKENIYLLIFLRTRTIFLRLISKNISKFWNFIFSSLKRFRRTLKHVVSHSHRFYNNNYFIYSYSATAWLWLTFVYRPKRQVITLVIQGLVNFNNIITNQNQKLCTCPALHWCDYKNNSHLSGRQLVDSVMSFLEKCCHFILLTCQKLNQQLLL